MAASGLAFNWWPLAGALRRRVGAPPPPPPPSGNLDPETVAGSAPVGSTAYAIPSGALFVDPVNGNNANTGAIGSPFQTCEFAISRVAANGTIVLRAGTYHEGKVGTSSIYGGISINTAGVTIQAYPNEAVWFDGSSVVSGWSVSGSQWIHTGWTLALDRSPTFSFGAPDGTTSGWQFVDPAFPTAAWPEQLFIDGVAQLQVNSAAAATAGKFFIDQATDTIYIGSTPVGKEVRVSDLQTTITGVAIGTKFKGIGFRRFAPSMPHLGCVKMLRDSCVVENCWFEDISACALSFQTGANAVCQNVTMLRIGNMGIHTNRSNNILYYRVRSTFCNSRRFNVAPASGGIKITQLVGAVVKECVISDNYTTGFWADESVQNLTIITSNMQRNTHHGIVAELCGTTILANNLITDNQADGTKVINTDSLTAWNNTFVNNCSKSGSFRMIDITADNREPMTSSSVGLDTRYPVPRPDGMDWVMTSAVVQNCIDSKTTLGQTMISIEDYNKNGGNARAWTAFGPAWDGNFYNRLDTSHPTWFSLLPNAGAANASVYFSLSALKAATGLEANSTLIDGVDAMNADYTIKSAYLAAAEALARPLPSSIAALIGQPTGTKHVGCWR